jgi:hypothetical protein
MRVKWDLDERRNYSVSMGPKQTQPRLVFRAIGSLASAPCASFRTWWNDGLSEPIRTSICRRCATLSNGMGRRWAGGALHGEI